MSDLNKAALVTGGTTGIGLASATALADQGYRVFVTGRSAQRLAAAVEQDPRLEAIATDVSDPAAIEALSARLKAEGVTLDVLVANAGTAETTVFGQTDVAAFDRTFDLNVRGVFFTVQTLAPLLADGASVILIGSIVSIKGMADLSVYNASKAAVRSFARSWANDLRARRIRVNTLSPGPVRTPLVQRLQGQADGSITGFEAWAAEAAPAGRIGEPQDIAAVVSFLASDAAGYVNGVELFVDGGLAQI
ncbi:SDR family NAD(P)-dependent oxidoreductase [Brevundimonas sp. SORGH_AS_0993]|uniref:SDR family NAD(P)-dependent oxidoreductase n=1 Tax=Brevundimonas sp. SORGH_AS_0993 TaxID=3041794 RepID=UPI002784F468|nr:SDR family oxidoreductase [Brevundimonas sp. SORGH_AS_0993]MDQ1155209.1 NAD(P)-dependent dehydrogenase (short-subunit alcohol dehydrogenase family) [Brevundimonas sp. SORGH_AS_0993]